MAEISGGVYVFPSILTAASPLGPAHEPFDREDGALGVGDRLALGHLAHQPLTLLGERDDGRGGPATLGVGDDDRVATLHDGDDRVGRAEVNSDDLGSHVDSELGLEVLESADDLLGRWSADSSDWGPRAQVAYLRELPKWRLLDPRDPAHDGRTAGSLSWLVRSRPLAVRTNPRRLECCGRSS